MNMKLKGYQPMAMKIGNGEVGLDDNDFIEWRNFYRNKLSGMFVDFMVDELEAAMEMGEDGFTLMIYNQYKGLLTPALN